MGLFLFQSPHHPFTGPNARGGLLRAWHVELHVCPSLRAVPGVYHSPASLRPARSLPWLSRRGSITIAERSSFPHRRGHAAVCRAHCGAITIFVDAEPGG